MKILVGLSGGVDSAAVAWLLKEQGHDVMGATMAIWDKNTNFHNNSSTKSCFSPHHEKDILAAQELCKKLNIPYYVFDCSTEFKNSVLQNFKNEYLAGKTPNPCVWCNTAVKFYALPIAAKNNGLKFDKFATGHYARIAFNNNRWCLYQGIDAKKDQSYFLYRLSQKQLENTLMPLGCYKKDEVRQFAKSAGINVADKPDSQDFYTGNINDILQQKLKPGTFVDKNNNILGYHQGIWNYTIGQRRGMGISAPKPLYVIDIIPDENKVVLGFEEEINKSYLVCENINWVSVDKIQQNQKIQVKIRSSQLPVSAYFSLIDAHHAKISFITPQKAIAPGQSVVFYDNDMLLGGGIICR